MKKIIIAAATGAIVLGTVLGAGLLGSTKEDKTMDITNNELVANTAVPAIDVALPEIIETATFALG